MTVDNKQDNSAKLEKIKQILEKDYDIHSISELEKAMDGSMGIDIGIFITPIAKKSG